MSERRPNRTLGPNHDTFWEYCDQEQFRLQKCDTCGKLRIDGCGHPRRPATGANKNAMQRYLRPTAVLNMVSPGNRRLSSALLRLSGDQCRQGIASPLEVGQTHGGDNRVGNLPAD